MSPEIVAGLIFLAIYALIVTEKIHRTLAALLGASLMILLRVVDQNEAFAAIDLNVILLLAGMMIIANITAKTACSSGSPWRRCGAPRAGPTRSLCSPPA